MTEALLKTMILMEGMVVVFVSVVITMSIFSFVLTMVEVIWNAS